jgi:hypothetical protein
MVMVNYASKEILAKIVYYGPGLSGKTTNLEYINDTVDKKLRGKMVSMATKGDRTLFFDLLPVDVGEIQGFTVRFQLYTVPGQVRYNKTRKLVLTGADAIVFVADSQRERLQANIESLANMRDNLKEQNMVLDEIPWVMQYNKRDLKKIYPVEELERKLNHDGVPSFEGIAIQGEGVMDTLRSLSDLLMDKFEEEGIERLGKRKPQEKKTGVTYEEIVGGAEDEYQIDEIDADEFDFEEPESVDVEDIQGLQSFDDEEIEAASIEDFTSEDVEEYEEEEELGAIDIGEAIDNAQEPKEMSEDEDSEEHDDSLHIKTSEPNYAKHIRESQYLNKATKEIFNIINKYGLTMEEIWYIQSKILNMYIDKRIRRHLERAKMILDSEGGQIFVLRSQDDFED